MIFEEEMVGGRERMTTDEERANLDQKLPIFWRL